MQFIARLLFQYQLSTSLMTVITLFLTWFPLVVLGLFYLSQRARLSQERQGTLFVELALLSVLLLGIHTLLFGRQIWQLWHAAGGDTFYRPALDALESISVYLALPGGFTGLLCGFLLFDIAWDSRKFWAGFWGYTGLALIFLASHRILPYFSFEFASPDLADMLVVWTSFFLAGLPLVVFGTTTVAVLAPSIMRRMDRVSTGSLKPEGSDFAH